ncbi:MAG: hypothetical protein NTY48_04885 [Candidatus Diapherotrites archaeon]|nr:hypothetical protein [Candidatus Diapherotrites archaeon]
MAKKELSLYEIRDRAIDSRRAVFSSQQLANFIQKSKSIASVYLNRLAKKKLAVQLIKGKISFDDDEFVIASQLMEPAYISFTTALYLQKKMLQVPAVIECATPKRSIYYKKLGIIYRKIPKELFYGFKKERKSTSYIMLADAEKALIDSIILNKIPQSFVDELLPEMDKNKIIEYADKYSGRGKSKLKRWLKC